METTCYKSSANLLEISDLSIQVEINESIYFAVRDLNFKIKNGETFALVGESGSGKTMIALSILGLLPGCAKQISGKMKYKNRSVSIGSDFFSKQLRGKQIAMIFQNARSALNPVFRIGTQIKDVITTHLQLSSINAEQKILTLFTQVGLSDAQQIYRSYPHQLSDGIAQRVMIAAALLGLPSLLIADEPTSSLDMTIQRQILELLKDIKRNFNISMLYITHDLGVIAEMSDYVAIMYAGKIVEYADVRTIFCNPMHPYTRALLNSMILLHKPRRRPKVIRGEPPDPFYHPYWCAFYPRCNNADSSCKKQFPPNIEVEPGHFVRCLTFGTH